MPKPHSERVRAYCRVRPAAARGGDLATSAGDGDSTVTVTPPVSSSIDRRVQEVPPRGWSFDGVHGPEATQAAIYDDVAQPILDAVLQGYNGTILAYGQTGAGKTHTLLHKGATPDAAGLVPRLVAALFVAIGVDTRHVYRVRASFAQIYNEQIDDLLKPRNGNLKVKAGPAGSEVEGLTQQRAGTAEELMTVCDAGRRNLVYAETRMNKSSSRSHAVLQLQALPY